MTTTTAPDPNEVLAEITSKWARYLRLMSFSAEVASIASGILEDGKVTRQEVADAKARFGDLLDEAFGLPPAA